MLEAPHQRQQDTPALLEARAAEAGIEVERAVAVEQVLHIQFQAARARQARAAQAQVDLGVGLPVAAVQRGRRSQRVVVAEDLDCVSLLW